MLPFPELAALLVAPDPGRTSWSFPATVPGQFSSVFALVLLEAAVQAQARGERLLTIRDDTNLCLACGGEREASRLLNVRGDQQPGPTSFHQGRVYRPFLQSFEEHLALLPNIAAGARQIWVTGHGLGAADALLAALHLQAAGVSVAGVYTFGAPRVGDQTFVRSFRVPVYRVVNGMDPVATLPPHWHYRHVGRHLLFDGQGRLLDQPSALSRLPDLARQSAWLGELLLQGLRSGYPRPLYTLLRTVLSDHSPASYLTRLRHLAEQEQR